MEARMGIDAQKKAELEVYQRTRLEVKLEPADNSSGQLANDLKSICQQSGGACTTNAFDLYTWLSGGYAMKFNIGTLHIQVFGTGKVLYHYDTFNMRVSPVLHISVDVLWNDGIRQGLKLLGI